MPRPKSSRNQLSPRRPCTRSYARQLQADHRFTHAILDIYSPRAKKVILSYGPDEEDRACERRMLMSDFANSSMADVSMLTLRPIVVFC